MGSPFPMLSIIFTYIYFVKVMGPNYMKNKKPYQIEGLIIAYNVLMVILSAFFFFYVSRLCSAHHASRRSFLPSFTNLN